jgi:hypothetical protein
MRALIREIKGGVPALIAGDWNTNTFDRGTLWRTLRSILRLAHPSVREAVLQPVNYEPLFEELRRAGFVWDGFNDSQPTCHASLDSLEDRKYVPAPVRNYILRRIPTLPLRLDWIAGRGVRPLRPGRTIQNLPAASDHLPVLCDIEVLPNAAELQPNRP